MKRRTLRLLCCLASFSIVLAVLLAARDAEANTPTPNSNQFRVCLRADMTGFVDRTTGDRATNADLPMYGIRYRLERYGNVVQNWTDSDPNDGCFLAPKSSAYYVIKVKPKSAPLGGNNTVRVNKPSGSLSVFAVTTPWMGSGATTYEVVFPSKGILRIYTVLAFAIERAFRGRYADTDLIAWKGEGSNSCSAAGTVTCTISGNPNVVIAGDSHTRRFVIAHEYGHANMKFGAGGQLNECNAYNPDDESGTGHFLRGREASSCAASEGFAHFMSADIFNWHNAGTGSSNPQAEFMYPDGSVVGLGDGSGGCPTYPLTEGHPNENARPMHTLCVSGALHPTIAIELDWARTWWDYHEDTNKGGAERGHGQLHDDLVAAGPWAAYTAYETMETGLSSSLSMRFATSAEWNGVCSGTTC